MLNDGTKIDTLFCTYTLLKQMMNFKRTPILFCFLLGSFFVHAQAFSYQKGYFQNPLHIKMELVANFGELRANHWHMGLDIRTQQRQNLPVHAAAEGYIARVKIEPGGFGRAIYINHPNGLTTLYAHLNDFYPPLEQYIKERQYQLQSWEIDEMIPANKFPVKKGTFIAYSGTTGGSQGPHVHFEIRDTKTENCLNPLLFGFPIPDAVPPSVYRIALYNRNLSVYNQNPQLIGLKKVGSTYSLASGTTLKVGTNKVSFAIGAVDRFSNSTNPNGIYSARILCDDVLEGGFVLNDIGYGNTRYLNAQIDYRYKYNGGAYLQHLNRMTGDTSSVYIKTDDDVIVLSDTSVHQVKIEVKDADMNTSQVLFNLQYVPSLEKALPQRSAEQLLPQNINVFETDGFELFTSEFSVYDTVDIVYSQNTTVPAGAVSPLHTFLNGSIPTHDSIMARIKPVSPVATENKDRVVIKSVAGSRTVVEKAMWQGDWVAALFRQFGTFQAFIDNEPPTINAPGVGSTIDLSKSSRIVFTPKDNFKTIKAFRAEVDGQWLRFTNDKGYSHIYKFDEKFPSGLHELKVTIEDVAGNVTTKTWTVKR